MVQSRNVKDLHADVAIGVTSADLVHIANISYRLNRKLQLDPAAAALSASAAEAASAQPKFVGDDEATKMLTRNYRAPYVVPAKV